MGLVRPRLTDYYGLCLAQNDIDFAIPFLDEDLPFCVDPFLLWKSPSLQDNGLHASLINSFNYLGFLFSSGKENTAIENLKAASECDEVGLGFSATRRGKRISSNSARDILSLFKIIPEISKNGFNHLETIQLYVDNISKDRVSDITCSYLKSFLIDYTIDQSTRYGIPLRKVKINAYNAQKQEFLDEDAELPINPVTNSPLLLIPKRWLRRSPWITADDYIKDYFLEKVLKDNEECPERGEILN